MFHSLARANLHVGDRIGDFDKTIVDFAARKGFIVGRASFPRGHRWVDNIKVDADSTEKTFITFNNFRDVNVIEANAYSHEDAAKWKKMWYGFLNAAANEFGKENVKITKDP